MWEKSIKQRGSAVIFKKYDENGIFQTPCIIPSDKYPLNNGKNNPLRVFHNENTVEITDEHIGKIIDSVPYEVGKCYQTTTYLRDALQKAGYDARAYAGWECFENTQFPIHHAWVVLDNSIIDLSEWTADLLDFRESCKSLPKEEVAEKVVEYRRQTKDLKNTQRSKHIGKCRECFYYIGCECEPETARYIYRSLMEKYPNHESSRNINKKSKYSSIQQLFAAAGVL